LETVYFEIKVFVIPDEFFPLNRQHIHHRFSNFRDVYILATFHGKNIIFQILEVEMTFRHLRKIFLRMPPIFQANSFAKLLCLYSQTCVKDHP
jgi:hypothetical protein